jgi:hypothetical protein
MVMVADNPTSSTRSAPIKKPVMLPRMAALVTQPAAVARTLVGNSSERWAAKAGVSMAAPKLAASTAGASTQPLDAR